MTHMSTLYHTCIEYIVIHGTIGKGVGRVSPLPLTFLLFLLSSEFLEPFVDFLHLLLEESLLVFEKLGLLFLAGGLSPWGKGSWWPPRSGRGCIPIRLISPARTPTAASTSSPATASSTAPAAAIGIGVTRGGIPGTVTCRPSSHGSESCWTCSISSRHCEHLLLFKMKTLENISICSFLLERHKPIPPSHTIYQLSSLSGPQSWPRYHPLFEIAHIPLLLRLVGTGLCLVQHKSQVGIHNHTLVLLPP